MCITNVIEIAEEADKRGLAYAHSSTAGCGRQNSFPASCDSVRTTDAARAVTHYS
jgi:hypothetical protein